MKKSLNMKAVIYTRCSTGRQAEKELSIQAQEKICKDYALKMGYEIDNIFSDEGESATTFNRPGFLDAIEYSRNHKKGIAAFICYDTSRFARNREDAIVYKKLLRSSGVKVLYATQSFSDDPDGEFLEGILELIDERYSKVLGIVTLRGMRENARRGNMNGAHPPYGYQASKQDGKRQLEIYEPEADIVKRLYQYYLAGEGYKLLASRMNREGYRGHNGKPFGWKTIEKILTNETYTGVLKFQEIRVSNIHPVIIPNEIWNKVQEERKKREPKKLGSSVCSTYVFSGLLYCAYCESPLTIEKGTSHTGKVHSYYSCSGKRSKRIDCKGVRCPVDKLDKIMQDRILNVILDNKSFESLAQKIHQYKIKLRTKAISEIPNLKKKLTTIDAKINNIVKAIAEGTIKSQTAKAMLEKLELDKDYVKEEIERLTQKHLDTFNINDRLVITIRNHVYNLLNNASPKEKRQFLRKFIGKIVINKDSASIYYNLLNLTANTLQGSHLVGGMASPRGFEPLLPA